MNYIEIQSLPRLRFAHIYRVDQYHRTLPQINNQLEISYLAEGSVTLCAEGNVYTAEKGDIVCNRLAPLRIDTDEFHCHHTFCVNVDWLRTTDTSRICLPYVTKASNATAEITALIDKVIYSPHLFDNSPEKVTNIFFDILCKIDDCNRNDMYLGDSEGHILVERAKKYIHHNLLLPLTQKEIASHLDITPGYLCNLFKKYEGITMMRYINQLKLKNIKDLMENQHITLHEGAAMYGYNDPNYVSHLHRKIYGYSITHKPDIAPIRK